MAHLLLIDDDPALIQEQVRQAFPAPEHRVEVAGTGAAGLGCVSTDAPDVILLDLRLPDGSGMDVFQQIRQIDARIPVIFITMAKGADAAIEAMKHGAYDYLFKPLGQQQLRRVVDEALDVSRRMRQPAIVAEVPPDPDVEGAILGACPAMREVYKAIGHVAGQDVTVLDHRREWYRQRAGRPRHLSARLPGSIAVPGAQLRRDPGDAAGERAVRTREGRLYRGRSSPHRQVSNNATAAPFSSTRSATCP